MIWFSVQTMTTAFFWNKKEDELSLARSFIWYPQRAAFGDKFIQNEIATTSRCQVHPISIKLASITANMNMKISPITVPKFCTVHKATHETTYCTYRYIHCPLQLLCSLHQVCLGCCTYYSIRFVYHQILCTWHCLHCTYRPLHSECCKHPSRLALQGESRVHKFCELEHMHSFIVM